MNFNTQSYYIRVIFVLLLVILATIESFGQIKSQKIQLLTESSDLILIGKVHKQNSYWNKNRSRIYTDVSIKVSELLKGKEIENTVTVKHMGGEIGEIGEMYTHMPTFNNEEEVLIFVKEDKEKGKFRVIDGENGKIQVFKDKLSSNKITALNESLETIKATIKNYTNN